LVGITIAEPILLEKNWLKSFEDSSKKCDKYAQMLVKVDAGYQFNLFVSKGVWIEHIFTFER